MFVVIFEVQPRTVRWDDYLETARLLRPELERIRGFIDNERYTSERIEGRVLSLSTWSDEKALVRWRTHARHHVLGQQRGRNEIFADYHLRVGEVVADTRPPAGASLHQQRFDETEVSAATAITIVESTGTAAQESANPTAALEREAFRHLNDPTRQVVLLSWPTLSDAQAAEHTSSSPSTRIRYVRVIRDYGLADRREAPQWFPPVTEPACTVV
jgi:heme-degrading monooxygenase HmoA